MESVNSTNAGIIATANPGACCNCRRGTAARIGQRAMQVAEVLDLAYKNLSGWNRQGV
jgi:hypothetical protein